ncbi:MAG: sodium:solute symporter [Bacteroidales bacterium]|nr:sodium:solute symporter [Bacteroidales bacterium]
MSSIAVLAIIAAYFAVILLVSYLTTHRQPQDNKAFFVGGRQSPWYIVAIAMIGTSISGVTFISVPGMVAGTQFSYLQMVLGFVAGYFAIAYILLPLYYKLNLCSIYGYLDKRYGSGSYRIGAIFFLISKFLGCGVRMYLTAIVLQLVLFDGLGIPFAVNIAVTMLVVWLYTFRGGVKTLVWTDMVQTLSLVMAVVLCIYFVCRQMNIDLGGLWSTITDSDMSRTWFFDDGNDKRFFFKQFLAGMFTTIAMTGLDQDMMQKNLSCRSLRDAQKNVISYGFAFLPINLLFLALGVLLYQYAASLGLFAGGELTDIAGNALKSDELFPYLATSHDANGELFLPTVVGVLFVLGLVAAAFSSAGSAVTALTTSVTIDILRADRRQDEAQLRRTRFYVHIINTLVMGVLIYMFRVIGNTSVIDAVYVVASYTYGPLLGLYIYGLYSRRAVRDAWVPVICIASPLICLIINLNSEEWLGGYKMGYELLLLNGAITALGLWISGVRMKN